jgi:hypothetical protein
MPNNCGECKYSLVPVRTCNGPICGCKLGIGQIMSAGGIHMVPLSHSCKQWVGNGSWKARRTGADYRNWLLACQRKLISERTKARGEN